MTANLGCVGWATAWKNVARKVQSLESKKSLLGLIDIHLKKKKKRVYLRIFFNHLFRTIFIKISPMYLVLELGGCLSWDDPIKSN